MLYFISLSSFILYIVTLGYKHFVLYPNTPIAFQFLPLILLLALLPGLLRRNTYTFIIAAFVSLFYFCGAVLDMFRYWQADNLFLWVAHAQLWSLVIFFITALFYIKYQKNRKP